MRRTPDSVDEALKELIAAAEEARIDYGLLGGYAVATWGVPRATYDVDLLVAPAADGIARLFDACSARGFAVDDVYRRGWRDRVGDMLLAKVQLFRDGRAVTCDVFPVSTPFQEAAFTRCRKIQVPGLEREVRVVSPADLVLLKLLADRPKDRVDVQNVLLVQGIPDREHLFDWARRLGITERLQRALRDAGLLE